MIIHRSPLPDLAIPDVPITEYVLRGADGYPDRPALIDGPTGRTYTYGQLKGMVHAFAGGLAARGLGKGDTIALMAPNIPEYAIVFHGAAVAGVAVSTINPTYTAEEVRFQLNDSRRHAAHHDRDVRRDRPGGDRRHRHERDRRHRRRPRGHDAGDGPVRRADRQVPVDVDEDVVVLPYSSGTTGFPKGVMLTHKNLVANLVQCEGALTVEDGEVILAVLPFFHIYGMQVLMNEFLSRGATIFTLPRFDLEQVLTTHPGEAHRPVLRRAAHRARVRQAPDDRPVRPEQPDAGLLRCRPAERRAGAGGGRPARLRGDPGLRHDRDEPGEPRGHVRAATSRAPWASPSPTPRCASSIPPTGEDQGVDHEGELWVRGPQVMKGYLNNPEATASTIDEDGWLHTGDIATIDSDGLRRHRRPAQGAHQVQGLPGAPAELEALLLTHPAVADAAVVGRPRRRGGRDPARLRRAQARATRSSRRT